MTRDKDGAFQRGSALFMILMAVALFAALAFTFSRGLQQGSENLSERQADLAATDILGFASKAERTISTMLQARGRSEVDLNFDGLNGTYTNSYCSSDACKFFSPAGGGMAPMVPMARWLDPTQTGALYYGSWYASARFCVDGVGDSSTCIGTSGTDLLLILPYLQARICERINLKLGIAAPVPVIAAPGAIDAGGKFDGSFNPGSQAVWSDAALNGRNAGCFSDTSLGTYHFYQVLIAR